jgi:endonuclease III
MKAPEVKEIAEILVEELGKHVPEVLQEILGVKSYSPQSSKLELFIGGEQ